MKRNRTREQQEQEDKQREKERTVASLSKTLSDFLLGPKVEQKPAKKKQKKEEAKTFESNAEFFAEVMEFPMSGNQADDSAEASIVQQAMDNLSAMNQEDEIDLEKHGKTIPDVEWNPTTR